MKKENTHIKVNMSGKEYMEYKEKKINKITLSKGLKKALPWFLGSFCLVVLLIMLVDYITPQQPTNITWEGIGMFMAVCAGLGWVLHGTGFLLVKG
jgi:hypothetical protein